jgi:hypothetical protein
MPALRNIGRWVSQALVIGVVLLAIGYFADSPSLRVMDPATTELKLVIRHSGKLLGECEPMSVEGMANLAPNMRQTMVCPREKSPLSIELLANNRILVKKHIVPSGIHNDGVLAFYQRFVLPAGSTMIQLRVRENADSDTYSHVLNEELQLSPDSIVVVEFTDTTIRAYQPGMELDS